MNTYKAVFNNCFTTTSEHVDPVQAMRAMKRQDCQLIALYERVSGTRDDWNDGAYTGWCKVAERRADGWLYVWNQGDWDRVNPVEGVRL